MVMLALVSEDGLLVVDYANRDLESLETDGPTRARIDAALASLDGGPVRFLIDTHWHPDHVGGNAALGGDAIVIAHRNVRARLEERHQPWWLPGGIGPMAAAGLPDVTFDERLRLHLGGDTVELLHFGPAHTDGDSAVWFHEAGVVHVGDLFHGLAKPGPGADMPGLRHFLDRLLTELPSDVRIVTGHGPVVDVAELATYVEMLGDTLVWVEARKSAGATLEQIRQERLPPPWRERWSGSEALLGQWLEAIYREPRPDS